MKLDYVCVSKCIRGRVVLPVTPWSPWFLCSSSWLFKVVTMPLDTQCPSGSGHSVITVSSGVWVSTGQGRTKSPLRWQIWKDSGLPRLRGSRGMQGRRDAGPSSPPQADCGAECTFPSQASLSGVIICLWNIFHGVMLLTVIPSLWHYLWGLWSLWEVNPGWGSRFHKTVFERFAEGFSVLAMVWTLLPHRPLSLVSVSIWPQQTLR